MTGSAVAPAVTTCWTGASSSSSSRSTKPPALSGAASVLALSPSSDSSESSESVLTSVESIGSIGGFYAIGSTRIKLLDWLLVLAVAGSIGGCLAHAVMKRMTRGLRERLAAEARAEAAAPTEPKA